jgi:predicted dehydrogenase
LLNVAVIGLGVGEQHVRAYLASGCRLRWFFDLDFAKSQRLSCQLGVGSAARSLEEILQDREVQLVSIASYDDAHFAQVISSLEAEKHVFVEKPLCQTLDELRQIKEIWLRHGGRLKLAGNLVLRSAPIYQWLKQKIEAGDFGEIYAFDGEYLYGRLNKITQGWRKNVESYSVMLGGGIHLIDLLLWLTGHRPTTVSAAGNRICTRDTAFRYNDYVAATMQCPSGMIARIAANFGCVHRHQHVLRVFGTAMTFLCDDAGPRLHSTCDPSIEAGALDMPIQPLTKGDLISAFVSDVREGRDLSAETQALFDGISVGIACDRAVKSQNIEKVEYI